VQLRQIFSGKQPEAEMKTGNRLKQAEKFYETI
jgi:hypothetical protein